MGLGHVAARQELREMMAALQLPEAGAGVERQRGRRRRVMGAHEMADRAGGHLAGVALYAAPGQAENPHPAAA